MTKKISVLFALFSVLGGASGLALAQTPILTTRYVTAEASKSEGASVSTKSNSELAREVESLRHRVEDLESQNRALAELLSAVKTKLDAMSDSPSDERRAAVVRPGADALPPAASIENAGARASTDAHTEPPATEQHVQAKPDSGGAPLLRSA